MGYVVQMGQEKGSLGGCGSYTGHILITHNQPTVVYCLRCTTVQGNDIWVEGVQGLFHS